MLGSCFVIDQGRHAWGRFIAHVKLLFKPQGFRNALLPFMRTSDDTEAPNTFRYRSEWVY